MAPPSGGLSPNSAVTNANSLTVNIGSPKSPPLPPGTSTTKPNLQRQHHSLIEKVRDWESEETDLKDAADAKQEEEEKQQRSRFTKDPDGDLTHDETTVDVITVPCPGGDALRSWTRDGLISRYFGAPSMRDAEVERQGPAPSWVRQGIRREANTARILLYEHPELEDGMTLSSLADALLEELSNERKTDEEKEEGIPPRLQRPLIFIAHSIGGLVVKMALTKAAADARYDDILRDCYGVAFFGTPHQGSSYFAMPPLAASIRSLLQLSRPLPTSVTDELRVGNPLLLRADEDFKAIAHDLRVWTLYETIDSKLSGGSDGAGRTGDKSVYFTAPLTSCKSAILGMRQERIFPLQSDHANVASFGRHNTHTLRLFLHQLGDLINSADASVQDDDNEGYRWTLNLEQRVTVEVHGFFDDPGEAIVRAWSTRLPLAEFLRKGPDKCLKERLDEVEGVPEEGRFLRTRGKTMSLTELDNQRLHMELAAKEGLGIKNQLIVRAQASPPVSPVIRPIDALPRSSAPALSPSSMPEATNIRARRLSSPPVGAVRRISTPTNFGTPALPTAPVADQPDRLSPYLRPQSIVSVGRSVSDQSSRLEYRDFPPFSQHARSPSAAGPVEDGDDSLENSPALPEPVVAFRKNAAQGNIRRDSQAVIVDEIVPAAFTKPDPSSRKFVWVHLPFNNPTWAKVRFISPLSIICHVFGRSC